MKKGSIHPALQMTDACNKRCKACLRIPGHMNYKLSYDQFELYMRDLREVSKRHNVKYQFITGGEPTIWKDGEKDIVDVIVSVKRSNMIDIITMPTNGKVFEDLDATRTLLQRISDGIEGHMIVGISIADYQENFNGDSCKALDNVLSVCKMPGIKVVPIALITLSKKDDTSERLRKNYPNVFQRITPLAPMGGGAEMVDD